MNVAYILSGGAPVLKRYKIGVSVAAGVPVLERSAAGVAVASTTAAGDAVGVSVDASTYTTTQAASMVEGVATVVINPDAILRAKMVGNAAGTSNVALTTNSVASSAGTTITITTGDAAPNGTPDVTTLGTAYCVSGNNKGLSRLITSGGATTAVVTVPFPFTIAVGDTFVLFPWSAPGTSDQEATLTTDLTSVRTDAAVSGAVDIVVADLEIDSELPRSNSYLHLQLRDQIYKDNT